MSEEARLEKVKNRSILVIIIWASLLTAVAIYNFSHNIQDRERYASYEVSIAEHETFKATDAYLRGRIDEKQGCSATATPTP